jgi:hypothetical protein
MSNEEMQEVIHALFNPEPDYPESFPRDLAPSSLLKRHKELDFSYLDTMWADKNDSRMSPPMETRLPQITRNLHVTQLLFGAALRTFADSILAYNGQREREGFIRYYPPLILTFWSGFETFVREKSELFVIVGKEVPSEVRHCLLEQESYLDERNDIKVRTKYRPVLDRYRVLLKYGYGFDVVRGDRFWQELQDAQKLRDYYTHLDVSEVRAVSSDDVIRYLEAVLMAIIHPCAQLRKTLLLGVYGMYNLWAVLTGLATTFVEKPPLIDMPMDDGFMFHCNFQNVDATSFPTTQELLRGSRADAQP